MRTQGRLSYQTKSGRQFGPIGKDGASNMYQTIDERAHEGAKAYIDGLSEDQNPYPSGSVDAGAWSQGYWFMREKTERIGVQVF